MAVFNGVVVFVAALAVASANEVTPVQKVIQLMRDVKAKAQAEKNEEEVAFAKFKSFCTNNIGSRGREIEKGEELMEELTAEIEKLDSDIKGLAAKLTQLNTDVDTANGAYAKAKKQREKDAEAYAAQIADYGESVTGIERAITELQKAEDKPQAAALMELMNSDILSEPVQRTVTAFLEMNGGQPDVSAMPGSQLGTDAPEANAYESHVGVFIETLNKLRLEFKKKKADTEKEDMNSANAYQMLAQDLQSSLDSMKSDIASKTEDKEAKTERMGQAKEELTQATNDHAEDVEYLKNLKVECSDKEESFKEKQQLRADEIVAIDKAIEIMSGDAVSGSAEEHLPVMIQSTKKARATRSTSFAQLRAGRPDDSGDVRVRLVSFLSGQAQRQNSKQLAQLAQMVAANPAFAKVKKMIDELITKLIEEATAEAEAKGFCDKELGTNQITRDKLTDTIEELTAKIDENSAEISELTDRIATLAKEISELDTALAEATDIRKEEKAKNTATMDDAKAAMTAVNNAQAVLKDFYEKAAQATALVQTSASRPTMGSDEWKALANPNFVADKGHKEGMQTFGKTYKGNSAGAGGILAMLEVIFSDFAALKEDTGMAEAKAQNAYDELATETKKSVAVKNKETEMLTNDKTTAESELVSDKKDLANTQDELLAAGRYYDKLKPQCVDTGLTHEKRAQAREEEIQSLQEALTILSGEGI